MQIRKAFYGKESSIEIILIDDGSTDGSWNVMKELHGNSPDIHAIRFNRNYGKSAALAAGIAAAQGQIIVTIDADLQDDPFEIPRLVEELEKGFDLVSGWKTNRQDPSHKKIFSKVFNGIVSRCSGIELHDMNCGLKAYRKEIFEHVRLYGEMHRFIPVLAAKYGYRCTEVPVTHHPRKFGYSKFGAERILRAALDFITVSLFSRYIQRPLHFFGPIGILSGILSFVLLAISFVSLFTGAFIPAGVIAAVAVIIGLIGVQSIFFGLIAEILTYMLQRDENFFVVSEKL